MRSQRTTGVAAAVTVLAITASGLVGCRSDEPEHRAVAPRPGTANTRESVETPVRLQHGYVGPAACVPCHSQRCEDFSLTAHFRASRVPDVDQLRARIEKQAEYHTGNPGIRFEIRAAGDRILQTAFARIGATERTRSEEMSLVFGGGNVDEIYHYWSGEQLYQLPIAYINPLGSWGNAPGYEDGTAVFERPVEPRCLECHATFFNHRRGSQSSYAKDDFILGVTCERCHGPGKRHADFHRQNPGEIAPRHISNPAEMSRLHQLEICVQCHGDASSRKTPPFSYRPGEDLDEHFRMDTGTYPEDDHTANQIASLRKSACFLNSQEMTCATCHDPHVASSDDMRAGSASCINCHNTLAPIVHAQIPPPVRGQCVKCHMPSRNVMNIWFSTASDDFVPLIRRAEHQIGVHAAATDAVLLEWCEEQTDEESRVKAEKLRASLHAHYLQEAEQLYASHRLRAAAGAYRDALAVTVDAATQNALERVLSTLRALERDRVKASGQIQSGDFAAAEKTLLSIIERKPNDAMAYGRLGMAQASMGRHEEGVASLHKVRELDPDLSYGDALIGWLHFLKSNADDSVAAYGRAIEAMPYNSQLRLQYGRALELAGRREEAQEQFRYAIKINPRNSDALVELQNSNDGQ